MTKKFAFVVIILYVSLIITSCNAYGSKEIDSIKQTIINVTVEYANFSTKCLGTAVYADGYILTTAHSFFDTYDNIYISSYCNIKGEKYALQVISIDHHNDLALLKCEYRFVSVATYKEHLVNDGDKLYLATDDITTHGLYEAKVINFNQDIDYDSYSRNLISITTDACYGDSGAPIIDTKGNIIGILCAKLVKDNNTFFVIKSQTIQEFLEDI